MGTRTPLWEVMQQAHDAAIASNHPFATNEQLTAAEIRAVRDWLVPEEPPPHRGMRPGGTNLAWQETLSVERQRLRAILTTEAERAEKGHG